MSGSGPGRRCIRYQSSVARWCVVHSREWVGGVWPGRIDLGSHIMDVKSTTQVVSRKDFNPFFFVCYMDDDTQGGS